VLLVDHLGIDGMIEAARVAREAGVPVLADFEEIDQPRFEELLGCVDHLILSRDTACALSGASTPGDAALALAAPGREVVAVTAGAEGCWYLDCRGGRPQHQPAFAVRTVDTTGCGDVFHGAYASALARGLDLSERIRFAAAAAALKATRRGGQRAIPDRAAVEELLARAAG
jgi:ribokinase